jgi:urea ABC transporter permease protein UrtC/urea ABC transporter permease protein UrtB
LLLAVGLAAWAVSAATTAAQDAAPVPSSPATAPSAATVPPPADAVEESIRKTLPELLEAKAGPAAVEKLSALRDARVLLAFKRIQDRQTYAWQGRVVFVPAFSRDAAGAETAKVYDLLVPADEAGAITGEPLATIPKSELSRKDFAPPRPVRNVIGNALRMLGLTVNDPAIRRNAARDLGNRRVLDALPELRTLATSDPDDDVRRAAQESVHLIVASGADPNASPEERRFSIVALGEMDSLRSLDMLKELLAQGGLTDAQQAACTTAVKQIERHKSITGWIQNVFSGLSAGSIYVLLALGLAITFGLMGVINMAHGEMLMIGAVTTWACHEFISPLLPPAYFDWYYVIAFPLSFLTAALVGLAMEVSVVRWLYKRPLDSLLATIGLSYVLIQAVRSWKGDNLGMRGPSWAGRNVEIIRDVVLPYNRLFLICLTVFCVLSVVLIFRYTRIGLMIRATVQNREMAQALGVNTRLVDMFTFAFGAGLAGLAGYGIVLTTTPTPEMGQTYIVKTFLTVVVGGVGKLAGVVLSGLGLGFVEKMLEPLTVLTQPIRIFDATWAQVAALLLVVLFMQRRPAGLFPEKGRMADQADRTSAPSLSRKSRQTDVVLGSAFVLLGLVLVPLLYGTGVMSLEYVNKLGYILAFAICAIGLDLVWGYVGVLSLCQAMFFAIGGYCMGLYLVNYGPKAPDGIPMALSYVMSDVSGRTAPWFLAAFTSFPVTVLLGLLLPGVVALLIGLTTFRSRVRGVYFSILTQAITVAAWLIFQKNDLKLGGTNGLTNFTHILGFPIQADRAAGAFEQTRFWLYVASFVTLMLVFALSKLLVGSGFGRVLVAIRDDETRLRFRGYPTWAYKAAAFTLAAAFAGAAGMLYVPQKGIINPHQMAAEASILVVAWVAVGGRGSLWGAVIGAILVSLFYEWLTTWKPQYWKYALGALFMLIPLFLRGGLMSIPALLRDALRRRGAPAAPHAGHPNRFPAVEGGAA